MSVTLPDHDADELASALSLLEDWLLHADEDVLDALARFGFRADYRPRLAVNWLVEDLARYGAELRRQLPAPTLQDGAL
jgi:hypothetical protein